MPPRQVSGSRILKLCMWKISEKNSKHGLTKVLSYSKLSLVLSGQVNARVAQRWSTSLPRRGSRVRFPSRALFIPRKARGFCFLCYISTERNDIRNVALFYMVSTVRRMWLAGLLRKLLLRPPPVKKLQWRRTVKSEEKVGLQCSLHLLVQTMK